MSSNHKDLLTKLFEQWSGESADLILPLAPSGSSRIYYRLQGKTKAAIGTYGSDKKRIMPLLVLQKTGTKKICRSLNYMLQILKTMFIFKKT